jgi:holo-[acyl-carrier protein] synthase
MSIVGIGTDIIECARIGRLLERHGERFLHRIFSLREIEYCQSFDARVERFAGRWAAKEAVLKALGPGWERGVTWQDLEIVPGASGAPAAMLHGAAKQHADKRGIERVLVSLSHCRTHATAFAIAERAADLPK